MKSQKVQILAFIVALTVALAACESSPMQSASSGPPKAALQFMDWSIFDQELAASLSAPLPKVEVAFYDRVTPSAMPERLQNWMVSVQSGGSSVKVVQPAPTVAAKNPFLLISAISSLWSASKVVKDVSNQSQLKAAQAFDAEIILKQDDKGDSVVDRVVFVQRKK